MPRIHLIPGLPAALVIVNPFAGDRVRVLVATNQPWRRIVGLSRLLLPQKERRELCRVLMAHSSSRKAPGRTRQRPPGASGVGGTPRYPARDAKAGCLRPN
jgi:hypothetical protein